MNNRSSIPAILQLFQVLPADQLKIGQIGRASGSEGSEILSVPALLNKNEFVCQLLSAMKELLLDLALETAEALDRPELSLGGLVSVGGAAFDKNNPSSVEELRGGVRVMPNRVFVLNIPDKMVRDRHGYLVPERAQFWGDYAGGIKLCWFVGWGD